MVPTALASEEIQIKNCWAGQVLCEKRTITVRCLHRNEGLTLQLTKPVPGSSVSTSCLPRTWCLH